MSDIAVIASEQFDSEVVESDLPVVVDVFAEWCGPCKMMAPVLDELAEQFADKVKVCKVYIDKSPDTAERFGIRGVPTLLLFKGGELVDTLVGFKPKGELEKKINGLLDE